jgi:CBS domain containing-hemolysin-like protein
MGDLFAVLLTLLLILANAFFVGAEFALISARRDRLEALAEQGKRSAVTVIRAGENLSVMLAGAQRFAGSGDRGAAGPIAAIR